MVRDAGYEGYEDWALVRNPARAVWASRDATVCEFQECDCWYSYTQIGGLERPGDCGEAFKGNVHTVYIIDRFVLFNRI